MSYLLEVYATTHGCQFTLKSNDVILQLMSCLQVITQSTIKVFYFIVNRFTGFFPDVSVVIWLIAGHLTETNQS